MTDLGISRNLHTVNDSVPNGLLGTGRYLAPEMFAGSESQVDGRKVDVYAFGITLGYMLTRRLPWRADELEFDLYYEVPSGHEFIEQPIEMTTMQVMREAARGNRPRLGPEISPRLRDLVRNAVAHEPSKRPDFSEMLPTLIDVQAASSRSERAMEHLSERSERASDRASD